MNRFVLRTWCACLLAALFLQVSVVRADSGDQLLMADFVVPAGSAKRIVVRGAGPTPAAARPQLQLLNTGGIVAASAGASFAELANTNGIPWFDYPAGLSEIALVTDLQPGFYTAVLSGLSTSRDMATIEVFDAGAAPYLLHMSARADVRDGAPIFARPVYVTNASRKLLMRGIGPGLTQWGVPDVLGNPELSAYNTSHQRVATNDNWLASDAAAMNQVGAFSLPWQSQDAAFVYEFASGGYYVCLTNAGGAQGVSLMEFYDVGPATPAPSGTINVRSSVTATASTRSAPAEIIFSRTGTTDQPLTLTYGLGGTAVPGVDYSGLNGAIQIAAGSTTASAFLTALPEAASSGMKSALITLPPQSGYEVSGGAVQVDLYYGPGTLYVANLRPPASVTSSAFGTGSVLLSADERFLFINLTFSGLSSAQTVAYLRLSNAGEEGAYLVRLPAGQLSSREWQIVGSGGLTAAEIVAALKAGKIYVSIETENYPSGELRGVFVANGGPTDPNPPPNPPDALTAQAASRFLTQATFGPRRTDIDELMTKGLDAWLAEQMALPASSHKDAAQYDFTTFNTNTTLTRPQGSHRQAAWWKIVLTGPDQLRQRVAFALSEIFVISDVNGTVGNWQDGAANYYDLLARNAFGNFRTLLEDVTLSPMMGVYLSHIRNGKATSTTQPDENYAREIMQLFTIGLNQLNPDGTLKLDGNGLPLPTYDQRTISEMAKVFTGWQFNNPNPTPNNFRSGGGRSEDYMLPMTLNPNFHDNTAKTIVGNLQLPANQGGLKDLADTLDALFNHPNTAPFISRQLIQRLVTSNPSSGYVGRVSAVFANNGQGVRGDLAAVVKAILLDPEARGADSAAGSTYGKLKEPLLRVTALLRAFNASAENGRYAISNPEGALAQAALRSPTVFNFFEPTYVVPGDLAAAGLYAPEYQILTDTTAISVPNNLYTYTYNNRGPTTIGLDLTGLPPTTDPAGLVDYLNLVFCAGSMPQTVRDRVITGLNAMPRTATDLERYRAAIYVTVSTQESAIQK